MGGFAIGLADMIAKKAPALGEGIAHVLEHTVSAGAVIRSTEEGAMIAQRHQDVYIPAYKQSVEMQTKAAMAARTDPVTNKPIPGLAPVDMKQIHTNAAKFSREKFLGPKDALGVLATAAIEKKHGIAKAQAFADTMAFVLKDNAQGQLKSKGATASSSLFKQRAMNIGVGLKNADPTYTPRTGVEKAVTSAMYQAFSPLIAIPHIATFFNGMFGSDPLTFMKGSFKALHLSMTGQADHWQALVQSGAFAESHLKDVAEYNRFQASGKSNFTGGTAAYWAHKFFHQPGFAPLRDFTLLSGANVGKMTVEQTAMEHFLNPSTKTDWQLKEFGLDPQKITQQQGKLTPEQTGSAIFRFVDKHYFLDNTLSRSRLLQSSPIGRLLGTYHGYVTRQSKLMARAMFLDIKNQGVASTIKNLAIGAVLFPIMGEGIKLTQETIRGQDSVGDAEKDLHNLNKGGTAALGVYAEAIGHVGAYGVYQHLMRGAIKHNLADVAAGPLGDAVFNLTSDTAAMLSKDYKSKGKHLQKNAETVERDLAYDTPGVSLLAQVLMHRYLPKKGEHPKRSAERRLYHHLRNEDLNGDPIQEEQKEN